MSKLVGARQGTAAISKSIAASVLRKLQGFRGYPQAGEDRFIEVLQEISVSVDHARAIMQTFDEEFPTIRAMRDTGMSLRPKFQPAPDQKVEWEKQYGKPDIAWGEKLIGEYEQQKGSVLWQAIRDSLYYTEGPGEFELDKIVVRRERDNDKTFWAQAMQHHNVCHPDEVAKVRSEISESGWAELMAFDWAKSV